MVKKQDEKGKEQGLGASPHPLRYGDMVFTIPRRFAPRIIPLTLQTSPRSFSASVITTNQFRYAYSDL